MDYWFWIVLAASGLAVVITAAVLIRSGNVTMWDIALFVLPLVLYFVLLLTVSHPKSLANLFEPFALIPIVSACFLIRVFAFRTTGHQKRSAIALLCALLATILIYFFVPLLPE